MKRITLIYPVLTSYILPVIHGIAESERVQMNILYSPALQGEGFGEHLPFEHPNLRWIELEEWQPFGKVFALHQKGLLTHVLRERPDAVLIWANPRYISFWGMLILGKMLKIPVYPRGHGLFKKKRVGIFYKIMYKTILKLSYKYICYTPKVKESLLPYTDQPEKLVADCNTLYNDYPVLPEEKTGRENGVFYIGRVRSGCGADILIQAIKYLNHQENLGIELHIIGDGPLGLFLKEQALEFSWLHYYGKIYDQKRISDISRNCRLGCVPGFMGLNVVHMMSLSLPVVTHVQLNQHMGPEPEYIRHKENGWLVDKPNMVASIIDALRDMWFMPPEEFKKITNNAYQKYIGLSEPSYHERLLNILDV